MRMLFLFFWWMVCFGWNDGRRFVQDWVKGANVVIIIYILFLSLLSLCYSPYFLGRNEAARVTCELFCFFNDLCVVVCLQQQQQQGLQQLLVSSY